MQISSSQIMIFGGFIPSDKQGEKTVHDVLDNGQEMTLTNKSMVLDVTVGSIKYGSEINVPSYFLSGGYQMPHQSQIYAFGLTLPTLSVNAGIASLGAE